MIMALRDRVAKAIQAGQTLDQVHAAHLSADYDQRIPDGTASVPGAGGTSNERFIGQLYAELKDQK
jgi:cyclase